MNDYYRCFHCGDIPISNGVIVHNDACNVGADEKLNEALFMCLFLFEHMEANDLFLPRVSEKYKQLIKKYRF